jgi:hypothetical protein
MIAAEAGRHPAAGCHGTAPGAAGLLARCAAGLLGGGPPCTGLAARWWRYHPLFADLHRARLRQDGPAASRRCTVTRRASSA